MSPIELFVLICTLEQGARYGGSVPISRPSDTQLVLEREADAVYAFTAVMASVSLDGRCLDVAVTHSPGLTDLSASTLPAGTWNLKVTYWRGDS